MTEQPHFDLPFRFGGPQAAVNEQDSIEEVASCVNAILLCPLGYRPELPEFGIEDPAFAQMPLDRDGIRRQVELWEPRASVALEEQQVPNDETATQLRAVVQLRTEE